MIEENVEIPRFKLLDVEFVGVNPSIIDSEGASTQTIRMVKALTAFRKEMIVTIGMEPVGMVFGVVRDEQ